MAACVTVTYLGVTPLAETVTVAERELVVDVLALVAVTVTEALFEPLVGETVNHTALSLTFQVVFELILKSSETPEAEPMDKLVGLTDKVGFSNISK